MENNIHQKFVSNNNTIIFIVKKSTIENNKKLGKIVEKLWKKCFQESTEDDIMADDMMSMEIEDGDKGYENRFNEIFGKEGNIPIVNDDSLYFFKIIFNRQNIYFKDWKIVSYLSTLHRDDFIEIYNVCTDPEFRRKGYIKELINDMIEYYYKNKKYKFWLGVNIDQSDTVVKRLLKMYMDIGFVNPEFSNLGSDGRELNLGFNYTTLTYVNPKYNIDRILYVRNFLTKKLCKKNNVLINPNLFINLRDNFLEKDVEYGGALYFTKINYINKYNDLVEKEYITRRKIENINYDDIFIGGTYGVNMPNVYDISFHIHPSICYKNLNCYYAWPSGIDMLYFLVPNGKLKLHFVITKEGVYSISLTSESLRFVNTINDITLKYIRNILIKKFGYIETYRINEKIGEIDSKDEFIKYINQFTYSSLLKDFGLDINKDNSESNVYKFIKSNILKNDIKDFTFFKVGFRDWKYMEEKSKIKKYIYDLSFEYYDLECDKIIYDEFNIKQEPREKDFFEDFYFQNKNINIF